MNMFQIIDRAKTDLALGIITLIEFQTIWNSFEGEGHKLTLEEIKGVVE